MSDSFLNHAVYSILDRIADFQVFYMQAVSWIAAICFMMALGMSVVKISLNACNPKEEFFKLFANLIYYWIMIALYPTVMKAILPFAMNLGYGAVFGGGAYVVDVDSSGQEGASRAEFYKWLAENSGGYFQTSEFTDDAGATKKALDLNLVDTKTGRIDLNKTMRFCFVFGRVVLKVTLDALNRIWDKGKGVVGTLIAIQVLIQTSPMYFTLCFFMILVGCFCYIMVLINYVMCLFDYYFLVGLGVLMVPLSVWEGTKSYTQTLLGSIGKIIIKLIVISSVLFLCVMVYLDIFVSFYLSLNDDKNKTMTITLFLEMALQTLFQAVFLYMMSQQTSAIAGFLSGGSPNLSLGEFAGAAASVAGTAALSHAGGKAAGSAVQGAASSLARVGGAAVTGGAAAALVGGGIGSIAKSAVSSAGGKAGGELAGAALKAPSSLKSAAHGIASQGGNLRRSLGLSQGWHGEGMASWGGGGGQGGGGGGGSGSSSEGGSGGGNSGGSGKGEGQSENKEQKELQGGVKSTTEGKTGEASKGKLSGGEGKGKDSKDGGGKSPQGLPEGANPGGDMASSGEVGNESATGGKGSADSSSSNGSMLGDKGGDAEQYDKEKAQGLHGLAGEVNPKYAESKEKPLGSLSDEMSKAGSSVRGESGAEPRSEAENRLRQYANKRMSDGTVRGAVVGGLLGAAVNAPQNIRDMKRASQIRKDMKEGKEVSDADKAFAANNSAGRKLRNAAVRRLTTNLDGSEAKVRFTEKDRKNLVKSGKYNEDMVKSFESGTASYQGRTTSYSGGERTDYEKFRFRGIGIPASPEGQKPTDSDAVNIVKSSESEVKKKVGEKPPSSDSKGPGSSSASSSSQKPRGSGKGPSEPSRYEYKRRRVKNNGKGKK